MRYFRYRIDGGKPCHQLHWRRATDAKTSRPVWLKFCLDAATDWKNAIDVHGLLNENRHICQYTVLQQHERTNTLLRCAFSLLDVIHDDKDGIPPCSVYEAGDCTLAETIAPGRLEIEQQRSILRAVHLLPCSHCVLSHVWLLLDCRSA